MRRSTVLAVLTAVGVMIEARPSVAQSAADVEALRKEVEGLKAGQMAIQKDLQEIKTLLKARPAAAAPAGPPAEAMISVEGAPFKGKKDARVTMVDFTDYQ